MIQDLTRDYTLYLIVVSLHLESFCLFWSFVTQMSSPCRTSHRMGWSRVETSGRLGRRVRREVCCGSHVRGAVSFPLNAWCFFLFCFPPQRDDVCVERSAGQECSAWSAGAPLCRSGPATAGWLPDLRTHFLAVNERQ